MPDAYHHCEELVRMADKDRFLAGLFAPADRRRALHALYAFNIEIARVREVAREPLAGEIRLQWWRDVITGVRPGEAGASPVAAALLDSAERFALPVTRLVDLIDARVVDLYDDPIGTVADLDDYAQRTSSTLIEMALRVLTEDDNAALGEAARLAGIAQAVTGLMRALPLHASRRQLYVPLDLLDRHGVEVEALFDGHATSELRVALAELRANVRRHLEAFHAVLPFVPTTAVPALLPVALVAGYLDRMDQADYDPFRTVIDVPQWRRQWMLWRAARRFERVTRLTPVSG